MNAAATLSHLTTGKCLTSFPQNENTLHWVRMCGMLGTLFPHSHINVLPSPQTVRPSTRHHSAATWCLFLVSTKMVRALSYSSLKVRVSILVDNQRSPLTWLSSPFIKALFIQHSGSISPTNRASCYKFVRNSSTVSSGQRQCVVNWSKATNKSVL